MAAERDPISDAMRLWADPIDSRVAFRRARQTLQLHEPQEPRDFTPIIIVPGALATNEPYLTAAKFENAGFPNVDIADISSVGSIREQAKRLEEHILRYGRPINLMCFSIGTAVAMAALMNPEVAQHVDVAVLVGGPTRSGRASDFNVWTTFTPCNDFLSDPDLPELLDQPAPHNVRIVSIALLTDPIMHHRLSRRDDIEVQELEISGHHRMYVDDQVFDLAVGAYVDRPPIASSGPHTENA